MIVDGIEINKKEILAFLIKGQKVKALKYIIKKTNVDLLSAKNIIDEIIKQEINKSTQKNPSNFQSQKAFIVRYNTNYRLVQ
ncbi:MAG: hypothetical protein ACWA45_02610 [Flavobacteriales bacterium]